MVTYEQIINRLIGNHSETTVNKFNDQIHSLKESFFVYLLDSKLGGMVLAEVWSFELNVTP